MRHWLAPLTAATALLLPLATASAARDPASSFKVPCDRTARAGSPLERGFNCRVVSVDRYPRQYVVYVPRDDSFRPARRAPVVFGFHGSNGSEAFLTSSGWIGQAERAGIILVFGRALRASVLDEGGHVETRWNSYGQVDQIDENKKPPGYPEPAPWPANDEQFVRKMFRDVAAEARVDRRRVFGTGFSNGSQFTARVGIELSGIFDAVTSFGGSLAAETEVPDPIPYLMAWGANDGHLGERGTLPVPLDPATWSSYPNWTMFTEITARSWGADRPPDRLFRRSDSTRLAWDLAGTPLQIALLRGVGHAYPRTAVPVSWRFFQAQAD